MESVNIRVLRHSAFYTPLLLTIKAGFLQEEGLQANYDIATADKTVEAGLLGGEIHVAQSAVATSFAPLDRGEDHGLRHFAQINNRDGFFLVRRGSNISFNWHDLAASPVLVDHFFQPLAMFRYALHLQQVEYDLLDVIDAGNVGQIDQAFRTGTGGFVHQQGPYAQQLESDGLGTVVASIGEVIGPVAFSSLLATQSWLAGDMARAFMRAYRNGQQAAIEMPVNEIAKLEQELFPDIDRQVLEQTLHSYQQLGCWTTEPAIPKSSYERALDVFEFSGMIGRRYAYEEVISLPPDMAG